MNDVRPREGDDYVSGGVQLRPTAKPVVASVGGC